MLDQFRKLDKVIQPLVENLMKDLYIDIQIPVNDDVPESGHTSKVSRKGARQHADIRQYIDCRGVVRYIPPHPDSDVCGDVQRILSAQLQTPFDRPPFLRILSQECNGTPLVAP